MGWVLDAVLTLEPNRPTLFIGESVTFTRDIREGEDADWSYTFNRNGRPTLCRTNKFCSLKLTKKLHW